MKNFTKQISNKALFKPTRWILLALMFLLGTSGAWAQSWYTLSSDAYFYFNDNVSWTSSTQKAVVLVGRKWNYGSQGVGSNAYSMTNIADTKLHYYKVSAWGSGDNGKYTDIAILSAKSSDAWNNWEGNAASTRRTYATKYSAVRNDNVSGKTAYYTGTTGNNDDPLTFTSYSGYANIPTYTATLAVQTRKGTSGTYSSITSGAPATLKLQGTILSAHGTSSRTTGDASEVTWPTKNTRTAVVTGLVTVSYSSLSAGYTFDGWYEGSTQKSTATSYSYNQSANTTITAKFTAKQFSINYKDQDGAAFSGTHESGYPTTHTYDTETTLKTATKTGYTFKGWFTASNCSGSAITKLGATAYTANITLYAKWELACITVNTPDVTANKSAVCKGDKVTLTLNSRQDGVTYKIGNTKIFSGSTTTYEFEPTGDVSVVASHENSCNEATAKKDITITVDEPSKLTLTYAETKICKGGEVTLNDFVYSHTGTVTWYNSYSYVDSNKAADKVSPTSTHKYYATAKNGECGIAEAQLNVIVNDKPAKPTLSAENGVTEIISGTNTVTLIVGNTETDATYTLYKDGSSTSKTGTKFENISEAGKYTVVGNKNNGCGNSEASNAIEVTSCTPISNPTLTITSGKKDIYCPGDYVNVTLTYNGNKAKSYKLDGKDNNNIVVSGGTIANNAPLTLTINGTGNISMILTGCDGNTAPTNELSFTVAPAPKKPVIKFTPNPVKDGAISVLTIQNYDDANAYYYNGSGDLEGSMVQSKEFQLPEGSYDFTVTATSKACSSLTATSDVATLVVKEGGVAIAILGDNAIYSDDPTDFVAMYVTEKNGTADFPDAEGVAISAYTWEYSANGTSGWAACKEYDGATLGVSNSGSKCNNLRPNKVGYYRCVISYIDGAKNQLGSLISNVLQVAQAGTNPNTSDGKNQHIASVGGNWTLPLVVVNTGGKGFPTCSSGSYPSAQTDKLKKKRSVDVKIFNADGTVYYDRKARMNYRGSSSLNFKKKSYAFCPGDEMCGDKEKGADYVKTSKENLFGLSNGAKDKDWVLYAAAADPSLMRNRVVFNTFKEMTGEWGVDTKYVELVVDGVYQGVYVLMDKITVNEKRVNITDKNGFIVKFDKTDKEDREKSLLASGMEVGDEKTFMTDHTGRLDIVTYGTKVDQLFEIEYPEKEDVEDEGGSWAVTLDFIKQKFEQFETALANSDYATVRNLIDYQSWADWFIINEYTKNVDAYRASCVFVYNGDKIEVMPLWDQELSFKNQAGASIEKKGCNNTDGLLIEHNGVYTDCFPAPFWFIGQKVEFGSCGGKDGNSTMGSKLGGHLLNDACFVNTIKQRWSYHTANSLHHDVLKAKVDTYAKELTTAITRESARWPDDFRCDAECGGGTGYNKQSYDNSVTTLNEWITGDRTTKLSAAIENLEGATDAGITITLEPTTGVTTPWVPVKVLVNAPANATIKYDDTSITEGITEKNDKAIKTVNDKLYTYIFPRPAAWGTGNVATPIEQKTYEIKAIITNASSDCPSVSNEATATIKLADEGNDNCTVTQ